MSITALLTPAGIKLGSIVSSKEDAIDRLFTLQNAVGGVTNPAVFRADILARESQGSTALPGGIAVPHAKSRGVTAPGIVALTAPNGVDFGAPDGAPSRLLFLLSGPADAPEGYLQTLSDLMTLLLDKTLADKLLAAKTPAEFLAVLKTAEAG
ncbi:MAG: PTS sugar transporter subunit IIA [Oscillospiraceae bacterium]